jgi:3-methyladenine DNA glycosylase AlkC
VAEELRNIYNFSFIEELLSSIKKEYPQFNIDKCREIIYENDWQNLRLKERMRQITVSLHKTLPDDYQTALEILYKVAPHFKGLGGIIFPDYVEQYGLKNWEISMKALVYFTAFSTSEFAIRPFLMENLEITLSQMLEWSLHQNEHVRRLASEGSRPRLPWGLSVPPLKRNPEKTIPILNHLKRDESLYVRKSVANHLNDISYTHPELVLQIANEWYGEHEHTDWIIKHACRSLLKKGNPQALILFGFENDHEVELKVFTLDKTRLSIGEDIQFSFTAKTNKEMPVRIEYSINYVKANGSRSTKVFMVKTLTMKQNEERTFTKKQSFKDLTTRKHYKGIHTLSIIINGSVKASSDFEII